MRLFTICEALSKQFAQKVYASLEQLMKLVDDWDNERISFNFFMTNVRKADIDERMPHGDYILKVYANCINRMIIKTKSSDSNSLYLDIANIIEEIATNTRDVIEHFVRYKPKLSENGINTNINSYAPNINDNEPFGLIEEVIRSIGSIASEADLETRGLPGVKLILTKQDPNNESIIYRAYHVTNPTSLADIASGRAGGDAVGWCTNSMDTAKTYTTVYETYVIYRNNQPTSQFSISKRGATYSNPFAERDEIAEHKNSQNEDENRPILRQIAKEITDKYKEEQDAKLLPKGINRKTYNQLVNAISSYFTDAEEKAIERYEGLYKAVSELNVPLLREYFQKAGYKLEIAVIQMAGIYDLGLPLTVADLEKEFDYHNIWEQLMKLLGLVETTIANMPVREDNEEKIISAIKHIVTHSAKGMNVSSKTSFNLMNSIVGLKASLMHIGT